jgi:hypothetical protein
MTPQFSLRENCDAVPPAGARPESAFRDRLGLICLEELTSEFCGGISPENSGVSDFSVLLRPH